MTGIRTIAAELATQAALALVVGLAASALLAAATLVLAGSAGA